MDDNVEDVEIDVPDESSASTEGIVGTVTRFGFVEPEWPRITIENTEPLQVPMRTDSLHSMCKVVEGFLSPIAVYAVFDGETYSVGRVDGAQVRSLIDLIGIENLSGQLKPDSEVLTGNKVHVFSGWVG